MSYHKQKRIGDKVIGQQLSNARLSILIIVGSRAFLYMSRVGTNTVFKNMMHFTVIHIYICNESFFIKIDVNGVGELIKIAIDRGKKANNAITLGVCGEHAGDPSSIDFFHEAGLDYISCSPYRIPIARVAAARSKIKLSKGI